VSYTKNDAKRDVFTEKRRRLRRGKLTILRDKLKERFDVPECSAVVDESYRQFKRFFRDCYKCAVRRFPEDTDVEILRDAINYCFENRTFSFSQLYDTFVAIRDSQLTEAKASKTSKAIISSKIKGLAFQVAHRNVSEYLQKLKEIQI
jgi:hypothetical protein